MYRAMVSDFPKTLYMLRQEMGISQRAASGSLKVSQALLSHYENGAREPGLDFLLRASEFYNVTTDFLLGRTGLRFGARADEAPKAPKPEPKDESKSALCRVMLQNAVCLLYDLLGRTKSEAVIESVTEYLGLPVCRIFRQLYTESPGSFDALFGVPSYAFAELYDMELKRMELMLKGQVRPQSGVPDLTPESLARDYPEHAQAFRQLLRLCSDSLQWQYGRVRPF